MSKWYASRASGLVLGLAAGAAGVFFTVRLLRSMPFGIAPFDPLALGLALLLLAACATIAVMGPCTAQRG